MINYLPFILAKSYLAIPRVRHVRIISKFIHLQSLVQHDQHFPRPRTTFSLMLVALNTITVSSSVKLDCLTILHVKMEARRSFPAK